ncbi:unnamed protein product [Caenorhabditis angaria]|uniref:SXP/RAL-2 family protein Ani s 5-like cation-binding domain-containing protein n=1 Tax=Caenorhabditis angaria TaxID=860376 RepID=A0A9P1IB47_9PELO|nr:unnamed protein product [Caenorhabditis angaria]
MLKTTIFIISTFLISFSREDKTDSIDRILENAETKTISQINEEIDKLVEKLDKNVQKEHREWKMRVEKEERQRKMRIFKALPKLSTKTQQKLIRIVMTQQNTQLTVGEKNRILTHIANSMDENTKRELLRNLNDRDLYSLIF